MRSTHTLADIQAVQLIQAIGAVVVGLVTAYFGRGLGRHRGDDQSKGDQPSLSDRLDRQGERIAVVEDHDAKQDERLAVVEHDVVQVRDQVDVLSQVPVEADHPSRAVPPRSPRRRKPPAHP